MKVLLHTCCAPCLIYPLERLENHGFAVEGFFYNPNIHPFSEYRNRKKAVEDLSKSSAVVINYPDYLPADFFQAVISGNLTLCGVLPAGFYG
jgi:predicted adenine nucleotide alpha hydrolase (AANH) superfamily ATPase